MKTPPRCGTAWAYARGCRCDSCRTAHTEYRRQLRAKNLEHYRAKGRENYRRNAEQERARSKARSAANREHRSQYASRQYVRKRAILNRYKVMKGCAHCGSTNVHVLELHHRDPSTKSFLISTSLSRSWVRIKAEVAKCDVLCRPCRIEHHRSERRAA